MPGRNLHVHVKTLYEDCCELGSTSPTRREIAPSDLKANKIPRARMALD